MQFLNICSWKFLPFITIFCAKWIDAKKGIKIAKGEDSGRMAQRSVAGSHWHIVNKQTNQKFLNIFAQFPLPLFPSTQSVYMQRLIDVWIESSPDRILIPAVRHQVC